MKLNPVCQKLLSKFETYARIQGNITETDRVQGKAHWAEVSSVQMSSKGGYSEARWRCCSCLLLLPVSVCVTIWCSSVCSLIDSRQWSGGSMQICCVFICCPFISYIFIWLVLMTASAECVICTSWCTNAAKSFAGGSDHWRKCLPVSSGWRHRQSWQYIRHQQQWQQWLSGRLSAEFPDYAKSKYVHTWLA